MSEYYTILTDIGLAKIINATLTKVPIDFKEMAVGDSGGTHYNPTQNAVALKNELWRGPVHVVEQSEQHPNWISADAAIPAAVGGFTAREMGLYDTDGDLIAIGKMPETYKPRMEEGSSKDLYLKAILEVANTSTITMKVDPTGAIANRKYVDGQVQIINNNLMQTEQNFTQQLAHKAQWSKVGDLSKLTQTDGKKIVITGDSLSFNRYDFITTAYAEPKLNYPGLLSWSYMIRDFIHRNDPYFKSSEELLFTFSSDMDVAFNETVVNSFLMPFNGQYLRARTTDFLNGKIEFKYKHSNYKTNKAYIYMTANPNNHAASFDIFVDNVFIKNVDNKALNTDFLGFYPIVVDLNVSAGKEVTITIKNFVQTASSPGTQASIYIHGIGSKHTPVHLTGNGGWTSAQILGDVNNRITQYVPDLLFLIAGANDIYQNLAVETYKNNMRGIINATRTANGNCEIVLLTSPQTLAYSEEVHREYNQALYELAQEYNCYLIDLIEVFRNYAISEWRFDNVHLTKYGNTVLSNHIISKYFGSAVADKRFVESTNYYSAKNSNVVIANTLIPINGCSYLVWNGTAFTKTNFFAGTDAVASINKQADNLIRITFSVDIKTRLTKFPILQQYGRNLTKVLLIVPANTLQSGNYIEYNLFKIDGTAVTTADWDTVNFNFMLNY